MKEFAAFVGYCLVLVPIVAVFITGGIVWWVIAGEWLDERRRVKARSKMVPAYGEMVTCYHRKEPHPRVDSCRAVVASVSEPLPKEAPKAFPP